jgi:hypothetical protein
VLMEASRLKLADLEIGGSTKKALDLLDRRTFQSDHGDLVSAALAMGLNTLDPEDGAGIH